MSEKTTRPTDGPWVWTNFCKPDGAPIQTVQDVADTVGGSALHSDRAELWGVTLDDAASDPDGKATVVCYTGNGPNAHNNARVIAAIPQMIAFLRHLAARDHGFVYSRDEKDALAILDHIDGHGHITVGEPASTNAIDPVGGTGQEGPRA